ncbi:SDR family NAD(P)-dependent oxidoreductase [Streptomyces sp. MI02-7b]|uniref:SDR family NAD(P)-dependent oxidoreductase n=1 Tax=Streptomyces sp. MI02-7b TaxID=462941 RepID=UPI0039F47FEE
MRFSARRSAPLRRPRPLHPARPLRSLSPPLPDITTPFGLASTAEEGIHDADLAGRRAVVTGTASGIGAETARAPAATGAEVTLAVRDTDAGSRVAADITAPTGDTAVRVHTSASPTAAST